jgi:hypothetical protein
MSTLYLCCHGLFAFVFYDDRIVVITPDIDDHAYKAGGWKKEARLTKGEVYSLVGANDPDHPNPRPALDKHNLFLSGLKNIDLDRSFCVLNVPFPDEFISLRHIPAEFEGNSLPILRNMPHVSTFPMLQVLKYRVHDAGHLKLDPFPWWKPDPTSSTLYLHYFAETESFLSDSHPTHAFEALMELLPEVSLNLKSADDTAPCPRLESKFAGIPLSQQLSLAERDGRCDAKISNKSTDPDRGARVASCFSVIVNAT